MSDLPAQLKQAGLRLLREADAPELHALVEGNRAYLAQWLPWAAGQELSGTEQFIRDAAAQFKSNNGFQAALTPDGPIVGIVGLHAIDWTNRRTSIGYWLAEDQQRRGIMTATVRALTDHAFEEWNLHRIEIHCAPANHRSRAIPERLGFREEATLRETEHVGGRWLDSVVYGLLADEWRNGSCCGQNRQKGGEFPLPGP